MKRKNKLTIFASVFSMAILTMRHTNATETRTFLYEPDFTINNNYTYEEIQSSPLHMVETPFPATIDSAFEKMCNVKSKNYQMHTVLKHNEKIHVFELYSLMNEEGNCGFEALSLDRITAGNLILNAFWRDNWNNYTPKQQNELTILLKNTILSWKSFVEPITKFDLLINESKYSFLDHYGTLCAAINMYLKENRPSESHISDLNEDYINIISYILGVRIISAIDHYVYEPLKIELPNASLNNNNGFILLYNTGNHWLRGIENANLSKSLPQNATDNDYKIFVKKHNIKTLRIPEKYDITNADGQINFFL